MELNPPSKTYFYLWGTKAITKANVVKIDNSHDKSKTRGCDKIVDLSIILLLKYYFVIHDIQQRKSIKNAYVKNAHVKAYFPWW